jgi:cytochrome d ubiquinol oxidase subunit II
MLTVVIIFLSLAILLYFLLGGADFGAGIIELFTSDSNKQRTRSTMYQAIGPIWEANHMWVIIAVVILFVGFPEIYSKMCTYLHIPILAMLMGIIARGTAFTFRNYDAIKGERTQAVYNNIFVYSSFLTPLFLGIIAGSAISRQIDFNATDFMTAYIYSWFNWFTIAVGAFTVALCAFLAAIYLIGEARDDYDVKRFIRIAKVLNAVAFFCGGLVFLAAETIDTHMAQWIFGNPVSLTAVILAAISLLLLWITISRGRKQIARVFAAFQVSMILLSVGYTHYPNFIMGKDDKNLSLLVNHATEKTIDTLATALLVGSLFILPALVYLFYSFRGKRQSY